MDKLDVSVDTTAHFGARSERIVDGFFARGRAFSAHARRAPPGAPAPAPAPHHYTPPPLSPYFFFAAAARAPLRTCRLASTI